mgnify:CR=1 FL=1
MSDQRRYQFSWDLLGDLTLGRPNLGRHMRLEIYRLMQFALRDVAEQYLGTQKTDQLFYEAGQVAGRAFYEHVLPHCDDLQEFVRQLQVALREMGVGVLRVEQADPNQGKFVLTVSEDLDCSGLPDLDHEICHFDEGFIAALMESFTGLTFRVKEIDCWCTGDRTCRFVAEAAPA